MLSVNRNFAEQSTDTKLIELERFGIQVVSENFTCDKSNEITQDLVIFLKFLGARVKKLGLERSVSNILSSLFEIRAFRLD